MKNERAVLYGVTTDAPERQYQPLVLAQAAVAMDLEPTLFYMGPGVKVVAKGEADTMQAGSYGTVGEMLRRTIELGVPVMVCEASKQVFGWETVEFEDGVTIAGAATINDLALSSGATVWF